MTDEGNLTFILGISVSHNRDARTIHLSQPRYVDSILERFKMTDANPVDTPSDVNVKLRKPTNENDTSTIPYCQAIGSLMYLMLATRPDIAAALNKVAQYSTNFDNTHWTGTKRIIRYVKGTKNFGLTLGASAHDESNKNDITLT